MQKFKYGDLVQVADDLGPSMSHFQSGVKAIVIGSYKDQYGGNNTSSYTVHIEGAGRTSWYEECQLELIEEGRADILQEWEQNKEVERVKQSDLDWIFANGEDVLKNGYGPSLQSLADCFGCTDLWGANGEGFIYYENARATLLFAAPYLLKKDKQGFLDKCDEITKCDTPSKQP